MLWTSVTRVSTLVVIQVLLSCAAAPVGAVHQELVEPIWFPYIKATFQGTNLQRCEHRSNAPLNGGRCDRRPKTCFFGNQACPDIISTSGTYPETRCDCTARTWKCQALPCPATTAPTSSPTTMTISDKDMGSAADDVPSAMPSILPPTLQPTDLPTPRPTPRPVGPHPTMPPTPRPTRLPTL